MLLIAGLPTASFAQRVPTVEVFVHVNDCYAADEDLRVVVDGRPLELVPAEKRDDSIGLCFADKLTVGEEILIEVKSGRVDYRVVLRREDGKTLAISAQSPSVYTGFRDPRTLIYD